VSAPPKKRAVKESLPPPVVIIKKGGKHKGGHHGGAWKVAYADFVTTMMALFIVLWAAGQDSNVRSSIANYFRNPTAPTPKSGGAGSGVLPANTGVVGPADTRDPGAKRRAEGDRDADGLEQAAAELRRGFEEDPDLKGLLGQVQVEITPEGLRVQLLEKDESLFFEVGSAQVNPSLTRVLALIARVVAELPNDVMVEGHTDSRQYSRDRRVYSNWELSADRANSARRLLEGSGLRPRQVVRVVGHADHDLLHPENALDPQNRRVSVLVLRRPLASRSATAEAAPGAAAPRAPAGPPRPAPGPGSGT
jgi:chemotaxis protein MotB